MRRPLALALVTSLLTLAPAAASETTSNAGVTATISDGEVSLCGPLICRRWDPRLPLTTGLSGRGVSLGGPPHPDFALTLDGARITSDALTPVGPPVADEVPGGVRITWRLSLGPALAVVRTAEAYGDVAGIVSRTVLEPVAPLVLSGYTLDEVAVPGSTATVHTFRAGADWREPGWEPQLAVGDPHTGDWRETTTGTSVRAQGEWVTVARGDGTEVSIVAERRDYASSVMSYTDGVARAEVDLSRDVAYTGPFEEDIHAENPAPGPARHRALVPGRPLTLEPAFTSVAANADETAWWYHRYLVGHRLEPYPRQVTFNTNGVDRNAISTGAKDDVDFDRFLTLAAAARDLGVDTFVLDDGWQAISGDWCPDSPECPEPRNGSSPKFEPRFPDATFAAVRDVLDGDDADPSDDIALGLWMTPMEFHPRSKAFLTNPQWACAPVGDATAAVSLADPNGGSNEAGIGVWNPVAWGVHPDTGEPLRLIDYIEERIERAITVYGATYFKFDFLVWIDCGGVEPVDAYGYRDAFVGMLDELIERHPGVTFQIDETNDYRLFPFESVARGPSWFQNGKPSSDALLHNLWNLAPYVPGWSLGQHAVGNPGECDPCPDPKRPEIVPFYKEIDDLMAVTLGSHITFWNEIDTAYTPEQRAQLRRWTDFYAANPSLAGFTYPLLEDPRAKGWTALQPWDLDASSGWLLAYRQASLDAARAIPLRGLAAVDGATSYTATLVDPADGSSLPLGTFTADELRTTGVPVTIDEVWGYAFVRLEPAA